MKNYNLISDKSVFELITKTRSIGLLIENSILKKGKNVCHFKCKTKLNNINYDGWWWVKLELDTFTLRIVAGNKNSRQHISFSLPIICFEWLHDTLNGEIHAK